MEKKTTETETPETKKYRGNHGEKITVTILITVMLILAYFLGLSTHFSIGKIEITHVLNCNDVPGICKDKIKTFTVKETINQ